MFYKQAAVSNYNTVWLYTLLNIGTMNVTSSSTCVHRIIIIKIVNIITTKSNIML